MLRLLRPLGILLALAALALSARSQTIFLGVLEDVPPINEVGGDHRAVRIVFEKQGSDWSAFPPSCSDEKCRDISVATYPREILWTVGFDGKNLGQLSAITPKNWSDSGSGGLGLQVITSRGAVPTIGAKSREFGGQTDASVYRPLVTNSEPFVNDPDVWKRSQLSPLQVSRLRQDFRHHFGKLCELAKDQSTLIPMHYHDDDIRVVSAYKSQAGWAVARLHLQGAIDCHDTEAGFEIDDSWFAIDPQLVVRYLDSGIWLVDAGDYDNDGHSELIFSINRDNAGGYEIFYDEFKKHANFEYTYH